MTTLGTFTQNKDGSYSGTIETLALHAKTVAFRPTSGAGEKGPHFRLQVGRTEVGVAWRRLPTGAPAYLSVKLDDPSFAAPIHARLVEATDGFSLAWLRRRTN